MFTVILKFKMYTYHWQGCQSSVRKEWEDGAGSLETWPGSAMRQPLSMDKPLASQALVSSLEHSEVGTGSWESLDDLRVSF